MPTLWPHQQRMLDYSLARNYALIYAGMSTGKTLYALALCASDTNNIHLILTPKPALSVYQEDVSKLYTNAYPLPLHVLDKGTSKDKQKKLDTVSHGVVVVNYETAIRLDLSRKQWGNVIADEGHRLGRYNSKTTLRLTNQLMSNTDRKIVMTGTAYDDGYEKLYGMCRWLNGQAGPSPKSHPLSIHFGHYHDFLRTYCNTYEIQRGVYGISGYRNIDKLAAILKPFTLRINTRDVIALPGVHTRVFNVPLTGEARKRYKELANDNAIELDDGLVFVTAHQLTKLIRLQQLATNGYYLSDDGEEFNFKGTEGRLNVLSNLLDELGTNPVVIFTRFKADVDRIRKLLEANDMSYSLLTGDTDTHQDWRDGKTQILISNIASGGVGTRLERAHHVIYWSVGYSHTDYNQSLSRLVRSGQTADSVYRYIITSKGTVDEDIYSVLEGKRRIKDNLDNKLG